MRIRRLDLIGFGCFTGKAIELPSGERDIHILFGPNEAGKSTALLAIENLLFGIDKSSPYNFIHDYKDMRIGAVLENGAESLEIRRRKGNKDTLLTQKETPIRGGEGALAPYLGGADDEFFRRMFSLDHRRLREGGREILDSQNEAGQVLFSAGTGFSGLREKLRDLNAEADELWAPRKAGHRKYYQALERFEEAEKAIREHTVTAAKWHDLKRAYDDAQGFCALLEEQKKEVSHDLRKLNRIRRVYHNLRELAAVEEWISELGIVIKLPEDAGMKLEKAERVLAETTARTEAFKHRLAQSKEELEAMKYDEKLLLREEDIALFHRRRIEVQKERSDLPNREAELAAAEANFRRLAGEAGLQDGNLESLMSRIPERPKVASARSLLSARGEITSAISSARDGVGEAEFQIADVERKIKDLGEPVDLSGLSATLRAVRAGGDIASLIRSAELERKAADDAAALRLKSLNPPAGEEALIAMPVAPKEAVQNHRDERRSLDLRIKECREKIRNAQQELEKYKRSHERLLNEERAVSPGELAKIRQTRDEGWALVKRRYVLGEVVTDAEIAKFTGGASLTEAYESAVAEADKTADRRFDNAQSAAEMTTVSREIAEKEELLESLRKDESALSDESLALEAGWRKMWEGAPFEPASPDSMLEWLAARSEILGLIEDRTEASRKLDSLYKEEENAKASILAGLSGLTADKAGLIEKPLGVVLEAASEILAEHDKKAALRKELVENSTRLKSEAERKRRALEAAEEEGALWREKWADALGSLGISENTPPEETAPKLDAIEEMREIAVEINQLRRERIDKIRRDIETLSRDVEVFVSSAAKDLSGKNPEDAIVALELRLSESKRVHDRRKQKENDAASLESNIKESEVLGQKARDAMTYLLNLSGTENIEQLKEAIQKSDRLRELEKRKQELAEKLLRDGDGFTIDELSKECKDANISQVVEQVSELEARDRELTAKLTEAAEDRSQKRKDFEAAGGSGRAAEAAARKESAIVEMAHISERYVRIRSAATMLEWAIERYRKENQDPMISRASGHFATLTNGSFSGLDTEIDERDRVQIIGVRPGGERVGIPGMSDGTADQLYLALRISAIEDYLERSGALPFVADDLFINFDDRRSAAGLKLLGDLSRKTQVLFFTHHAHLVELARETLGKSLNVVSLRE